MVVQPVAGCKVDTVFRGDYREVRNRLPVNAAYPFQFIVEINPRCIRDRFRVDRRDEGIRNPSLIDFVSFVKLSFNL